MLIRPRQDRVPDKREMNCVSCCVVSVMLFLLLAVICLVGFGTDWWHYSHGLKISHVGLYVHLVQALIALAGAGLSMGLVFLMCKLKISA